MEYKNKWKKTGEPDILFLDIEMPELDGIELKNYLQERGSQTKIIFVTSHEELVWEAFGENVMGFLCKPIKETAFFSHMRKTLAVVERQKHVLLVNSREKQVASTHEIIAIYADGAYGVVQTDSEKLFSDKSLSELEAMLAQEDFFRVHKSYMINLSKVKRVENDVVMCNDLVIPVARRRRTDLKEAYTDYLLREVR